MTPADIARMAINELEAAESCMDAHDYDGAIAHSLVGILATLVRTSAPSSIEVRRARAAEYDVDEMAQDREEIWHYDETRRAAGLEGCA